MDKESQPTPVSSIDEGEEAAVPTMSSFTFLNLVHKSFFPISEFGSYPHHAALLGGKKRDVVGEIYGE